MQAWIDANGWRSDYAAVSGLLAIPSTTVPADLAAPLHSLFTRTAGRDSAWTTVCLRPPLSRRRAAAWGRPVASAARLRTGYGRISGKRLTAPERDARAAPCDRRESV